MDATEGKQRALASHVVALAIRLWRMDEEFQKLVKQFELLLNECVAVDEELNAARSKLAGN